MSRPRVAIVHDYVTQRGGAERVLLSFLKAFPGAPVHTALYDPEQTFPEFRAVDLRPLPINRIGLLRRSHRLALPLLAASFASLVIDADVVLCSSSGWAHGVRSTGAKIVYCYTPARWLYQWDRYAPGVGTLGRLALRSLQPALIRWDRRSAISADRYVTSSRAVRERIRECYGIDADIVPPPSGFVPQGEREAVPALGEGFFLCVSRLLPYKNVDVVLEAFARRPGERLVVVGGGPDEVRLRKLAPPNATLLGTVGDAELRWLYTRCLGVVAAAYEDYGLTPLEAAAFGKPSAVLNWGGYEDTVIEGLNGTFFDPPDPEAIALALDRLRSREWDTAALLAHAERFSEERFANSLRRIVDETCCTLATAAAS